MPMSWPMATARAIMMRMSQPWTLADGEKLNREHPRSFFIPSRERRARLVVGEHVKLGFKAPDDRGERMWVRITKAAPPRFWGVLINVPTIIDLAVGAQVAFEARHVIAIEEDPQAVGYQPDEQAAVSRRVIERDQPPRAVIWQQDVGWFYLFAGDESEPEVRDSATFMSQTLGSLSDRFPALEDVFRAPRRAGFWLLGADGRYRPAEPPG